MAIKEKIGEVTLNLKYYSSGDDLYSDGDIENKLMELVQTYPKSSYGDVIREQASWPVLYHLSPVRENLLQWIDFRKDTETVLEIGAGCGAVTGALAEKAKQVTCVELSKRRSEINATRHQTKDNLEIIVGNFEDIEPDLLEFDTVTLIGVLEYAQSYIHNKEPYIEMLKKAASHLKPGGRLILAIENKLGMKYWAGCPEDHTGRIFDSIEGYPEKRQVRTFSRKELAFMLHQAGYADWSFYYPYPDYKFPLIIYSDLRLPEKGELASAPCLNGDRIVLFDESKALDTILDAGLFPEFSNSFLLIVNAQRLINQ